MTAPCGGLSQTVTLPASSPGSATGTSRLTSRWSSDPEFSARPQPASLPLETTSPCYPLGTRRSAPPQPAAWRSGSRWHMAGPRWTLRGREPQGVQAGLTSAAALEEPSRASFPLSSTGLCAQGHRGCLVQGGGTGGLEPGPASHDRRQKPPPDGEGSCWLSLPITARASRHVLRGHQGLAPSTASAGSHPVPGAQGPAVTSVTSSASMPLALSQSLSSPVGLSLGTQLHASRAATLHSLLAGPSQPHSGGGREWPPAPGPVPPPPVSAGPCKLLLAMSLTGWLSAQPRPL